MRRILTYDEYRAKIQSTVAVSESGCWEWQGYRHRGNYGQMGYRGKRSVTHRIAWTLWRGPIPDGLLVLHACDNKACCNPDHLFLGDQKANGRDLVEKGLHYTRLKTHCPHGHSYAEYGVRHGKNGYRNCLLCNRIRQRIAAGWPEDLAQSAPLVPKGRKPVNAKYSRKIGARPPKTHCKYGHELAGDNLYISTDGKRRCRKCQCRTVAEVMQRYAEGKTATQILQVQP